MNNFQSTSVGTGKLGSLSIALAPNCGSVMQYRTQQTMTACGFRPRVSTDSHTEAATGTSFIFDRQPFIEPSVCRSKSSGQVSGVRAEHGEFCLRPCVRGAPLFWIYNVRG